jgi:hypothetical protein
MSGGKDSAVIFELAKLVAAELGRLRGVFLVTIGATPRTRTPWPVSAELPDSSNAKHLTSQVSAVDNIR